MKDESKYGVCPDCGTDLIAVWFTEEETEKARDGFTYKTGRKRRAVDYLLCSCCLTRYCVDDSFDGPWR